MPGKELRCTEIIFRGLVFFKKDMHQLLFKTSKTLRFLNMELFSTSCNVYIITQLLNLVFVIAPIHSLKTLG